MLISHSHRFVFIHTIRTGGTSVARALAPYAEPPPEGKAARYLSKIGMIRDPKKLRFREHETALGLRSLIPAEMFAQYYKFAFVRNPWSWLVSTYSRYRTTEDHRHYKVVSKLEFPAYVDWEIERGKRHLHRYVCDAEGNVLVDFVGRQETLSRDFDAVCESLGIGGVHLPHVGARKHKDYREYYDLETREKVRAHWKRDIELFEYEFEPTAGARNAD